MRVQLCQRRLSVQRIRQQRVERTRRPLETEPEVDSYFEPFDRLVDELVDKARPPFGEAIKRLEVLLAGRYDLFPAELDEEGARLCDEIAAVDRAIIALCQRYCESVRTNSNSDVRRCTGWSRSPRPESEPSSWP